MVAANCGGPDRPWKLKVRRSGAVKWGVKVGEVTMSGLQGEKRGKENQRKEKDGKGRISLSLLR